MIKLLVSDLDGTLINKENQVASHDVEALKKLREHGIDICLASGRMDNEIMEVAKSVGDQFHRVSQNGAFVITNDEKALHSQTFQHELAKKLYESTRSDDKITIVCSDNTNFVEEKNEILKQIELRFFFPIEEQKKMLDEIGLSLNPSKITILGYHEEILKLQQAVNEMFHDDVDTFISEQGCLDIMPKNISKGNAVLVLLDHLQLKPEEIACVGDSFNDIPMFQLTPNSFAIAHAHEDVKKEASYVVETVSEAVEKILEKNAQEQNIIHS
ncbi:HAD family hydrolase [Bacillus songklensis]|uniref:HAD family hydrolase n=1 Tax=Bacillus songklensis TaxID=1069116 RepID=A0ABV8B566_9BACI